MPRPEVAAALLVVAGALAGCATTVAPSRVTLPDPLLAPSPGDALGGTEAKAAQAALDAAEQGRFARAEAQLAKLPPQHPVRELLVTEVAFARGEQVAARARTLAERWPEYASAWHLAAIAAHQEGDSRGALLAARQASTLRDAAELAQLASQMESRYVEASLSRGRKLLKEGDAEGARRVARELLDLVPETLDAALLETRAVLATGDAERAAMLVARLPDSPGALELAGRVAGEQGQWELALDLFRRLPEGHPERCELLLAAWDQWRLTMMPPHVARALQEETLTRRALAAILAWQVPGLVKMGTEVVPVFEDVVGLAEGHEIVVVARTGVMRGDTLARRFTPDRRVSPGEVIRVLERLAALLGNPAPRWCGAEDAAGCVDVPDRIDGSAAAAMVRSVAGEEGSPCSRN